MNSGSQLSRMLYQSYLVSGSQLSRLLSSDAGTLGWSDPVSHDCGSFVECGPTIMPHSPAKSIFRLHVISSVHTHTYIYDTCLHVYVYIYIHNNLIYIYTYTIIHILSKNDCSPSKLSARVTANIRKPQGGKSSSRNLGWWHWWISRPSVHGRCRKLIWGSTEIIPSGNLT